MKLTSAKYDIDKNNIDEIIINDHIPIRIYRSLSSYFKYILYRII